MVPTVPSAAVTTRLAGGGRPGRRRPAADDRRRAAAVPVAVAGPARGRGVPVERPAAVAGSAGPARGRPPARAAGRTGRRAGRRRPRRPPSGRRARGGHRRGPAPGPGPARHARAGWPMTWWAAPSSGRRAAQSADGTRVRPGVRRRGVPRWPPPAASTRRGLDRRHVVRHLALGRRHRPRRPGRGRGRAGAVGGRGAAAGPARRRRPAARRAAACGPTLPAGGFGAVVGNPPFQSQLGRATARQRRRPAAAAGPLRRRRPGLHRHGVAVPAARLRARPSRRAGGAGPAAVGGRRPRRRGGAGARSARRADLGDLWLDDGRGLRGRGRAVCAPVLERRGATPAPAPVARRGPAAGRGAGPGPARWTCRPSISRRTARGATLGDRAGRRSPGSATSTTAWPARCASCAELPPGAPVAAARHQRCARLGAPAPGASARSATPSAAGWRPWSTPALLAGAPADRPALGRAHRGAQARRRHADPRRRGAADVDGRVGALGAGARGRAARPGRPLARWRPRCWRPRATAWLARRVGRHRASTAARCGWRARPGRAAAAAGRARRGTTAAAALRAYVARPGARHARPLPRRRGAGVPARRPP